MHNNIENLGESMQNILPDHIKTMFDKGKRNLEESSHRCFTNIRMSSRKKKIEMRKMTK